MLSTAVNRSLQLTPAEVNDLSPLRHLAEKISPLTLFYGTAERTELIAQSENYAQRLRQRGRPVDVIALPGANHYTILDALFATDGVLFSQLYHDENPLCET